MMTIYSPSNVGLILCFANFSQNISAPLRAKFYVTAANSAKVMCQNVEQEFLTFNAFKAEVGGAGTGKAWHHIVEQNQIQNSGFNPRMVHHPENLIGNEHGAGSWHSRITSAYSTAGRFLDVTGPNQSLRQWLVGKPFEVHYEWGIKVMELTK